MSADFYRGVLKILKYQFCCGDDVTEVTNETTGMILAASADSLGTCDSVSGGKMMFASDGTNGLDGKNGINGIDGTSCTATALSDSSSYKIMCGEDSVGVILNGADGAQGRLDEAGDGCSSETELFCRYAARIRLLCTRLFAGMRYITRRRCFAMFAISLFTIMLKSVLKFGWLRI